MGIKSVNNASTSYSEQGSTATQSASLNASSQDVTSSEVAAAGVEITERARTEEKATGSNGQASNESIKKAVEEINRRANGSEAVFGIHEATNRVTIKIVDKQTKDVIKEFPAEETLDMIAKVWEMAGMMVDEKR